MGRRSVSSTKGGKYMNPTDQARKEARKKELKKNKKQRLMVRQAVLKGKDPAQLLEEMEKIDEMEFNVYQPSPLNEKVLKEKRKKLKETFDRVMRLYHADSPEAWGDLKRKELDYELRRAKKEQYFESVKTAQSVAIDEIPLPQLPTDGDGPGAPTGTAPAPHRAPPVLLTNVPVPSFLQQQQQGILKKPAVELQKIHEKERDKKDPPGVPPGPPPILTLLRELDDDWEPAEEPLSKRSKLRFSDEAIAKDEEISAQKRQAIAAGKTIDDFMQEVEHDQRRREERKERGSDDEEEDDDDDRDSDQQEEQEEGDEEQRKRRSDSSDQEENEEDDHIPHRLPHHLPQVNSAPPPSMSASSALPLQPPPQIHKHLIVPPPPPMGLPPPPPGVNTGPYHPPPPPMRPGLTGMPIRMPHGGGGRPGMPPGPPPPRMGMRMPPGPPPGMPPRMMNKQHHPHHHHQGGGGYHNHHHHQQQQHSHHNHQQQQNKDPKSATISAKPQIRNLSADVTRFVPSTLRTKKEEKGPQKPALNMHMMHPSSMLAKRQAPGGAGGAGQDGNSQKGKTKDDAYMQFMREMQGLL